MFGLGKKKDRKGKGTAAARSDGNEEGEDERAPLLGGDGTNRRRRRSSGTENDIEGSAAAASTQRTAAHTAPSPAVVRHGRGILSDDDEEVGDDLDDRGNSRSRARDPSSPDIDAHESILTLHRSIRFQRHSVRALACYLLLVLIGLLFIAFAILHVWMGRFVSDQLQNDGQRLRERGSESLVWRGPDKVKILDLEGESATVQIDIRAGIDVRTVFGWNETATTAAASAPTAVKKGTSKDKHDKSDKNRKLPLSRRLERTLVGWVTRKIGEATMDLAEPVLISPVEDPDRQMMQVVLQDPVTLPLHFPKRKDYDPEDLSWLKPITLVLPMKALDSSTMANFINKTIETRRGQVHVTVQKANVALGREDDRGWLARVVQKYGGQSVEDVESDVTFEVPASPDIPTDPAKMVKLRSYSLVAIPNNSSEHGDSEGKHGKHGSGRHRDNTSDPEATPSELLGIYATARIENPGYEQLHKLSLDLKIPFAWPYKVFLSSVNGTSEFVTLATGVVEPFTIPSDSPHFDVSINGTVERTGNSSTPLSQSLSRFITRYMAGKNNTVHVAFDPSSPYAKTLPRFVIPFIENRIVSNEIPGLPAEDRDLLKDLKIDRMRIHPAEEGGNGFECDGQIQGDLVMPKAMDQLQGGLNITSIWPDIILYDGLPPAVPDDTMPPTPLPPNAFARFKPTDWVPADTFIERSTNATIMRAMVTNVPLDILNRSVLQRWLAKIIFSGGNGVRTGIKGLTQARATVRGFGEVELHKLPVLGVFLANKPALLEQSGGGIEELQHWRG